MPDPAPTQEGHPVENTSTQTDDGELQPSPASGSVAEGSFSLRDCEFTISDLGMVEFKKHLQLQGMIDFQLLPYPIIQQHGNIYKYHPGNGMEHSCWELYRCGVASYQGNLATWFPSTGITMNHGAVQGTPKELLRALKDQTDALSLFIASLVQLQIALPTLVEHERPKVRKTRYVLDMEPAMQAFASERTDIAHNFADGTGTESMLEDTFAITSFNSIVQFMFRTSSQLLCYERDKAQVLHEACMDHGKDLGEITATKSTIKTHADAMLAIPHGIIEFKGMSCLDEETQRCILTTTGRIKPTPTMDTLMTILTPASFWAQDAFVSGTPSVLIKALKLHADVLAITIGTLDRVGCAFEDSFNTGLTVSAECHKLLSSELDERKLATLGTLDLPLNIQRKLTESRENTLHVAAGFIKRLEKATTEYNTLKVQANNLYTASVIDTQTGIVVETFLRAFVVRSMECVTKAIRDQDYTIHPLKRALGETLNALLVDADKQRLLITKVPELNSVFLVEPPIRDGEEANRAAQLVQKTARLQDIERRLNALYDYIQSGAPWNDISDTDPCLQTLQSIMGAFKTTKERHEALEQGLDDLKAKMDAYDGRTAQQAPTNTK
eukprot:3769571-Rhodomonas_salina.1